MAQLENKKTATHKTALFLYTVLVLLPAVVLGGLLWRQLTTDHKEQLAALPWHVHDAAARLRNGIIEQLDGLIERESAREFYHYHRDFWEKGTTLDPSGVLSVSPVLSPLALATRPPGVLAWFSWDFMDGRNGEPIVLRGTPSVPSGLSPDRTTEFWAADAEAGLAREAFVREVLMPFYAREPDEARVEEYRLREEVSPVQMPIDILALNLGQRRDQEHLELALSTLREDTGRLRALSVSTGPFELQAWRDRKGELHFVALRMVHVEKIPPKIVLPDCFSRLGRDTLLAQGFELDPEWLSTELPRAQAAQTLGGGMLFMGTGERPSGDNQNLVLETFNLLDELGIEALDELEDEQARLNGWVTIAYRSSEMKRAYRNQLAGLAAVGVVMIASLVIGVRLLIRSVRSSQEEARRMENFIATVTHELRTPVTAVKMYGEMLRDGWAQEPAKQNDYLNRIVHESDRLSELIDKILQKRRLTGAPPDPEAGDLNQVVREIYPSLELKEGAKADDLSLELTEGLPPVLLDHEALRDILVNLVDNARKYAPPRAGQDSTIRVCTLLDRRDRVLLEVRDQGPGIPSAERQRVFDAFYRLGDESTRSKPGSGLGLHIAQLQASSMHARIQVLPREGEGAVFRVSFKTLRPGALGRVVS